MIAGYNRDKIDYFMLSAEEVARVAGVEIRHAHENRNTLEVEAKGDTYQHVDLVTATDKKCEDLIIGTLRKRFPSHIFIGEESSTGLSSGPLKLGPEPTWLVDPIDGTTNFVHGYARRSCASQMPHLSACG